MRAPLWSICPNLKHRSKLTQCCAWLLGAPVAAIFLRMKIALMIYRFFYGSI
jgi:hypothetical protein